MKMRIMEASVGAFMLFGLFTLAILAFKISGLSFNENRKNYTLYAEFSNIGSLSSRARVSVGGVTIGRLTQITLDKETYMARVVMKIDKSINNIPVDSIAVINTAGLLGEKYVSIQIGGATRYMKDGHFFSDTQAALVLENLISKFLFHPDKSSSEKIIFPRS